jgi:polyribonucleotide nucleotidyltransferase
MLKLKMDDSVNLDSDNNAMVEFREFSVKSMIQTKELIEQLTAEKSQINFEKIKLNRIFNFSDFVFLNNSFPISFTKNKINFVKITNIKQKLQLTYYDFDSTGSVKKTNVDEFQDIPEGINYLKEVFDGVPKEILLKNNFLVESDSEK